MRAKPCERRGCSVWGCRPSLERLLEKWQAGRRERASVISKEGMDTHRSKNCEKTIDNLEGAGLVLRR